MTQDPDCPMTFTETLACFYARLAAQQEPLGQEFAQVLSDDLWDLLVRDPKPLPVQKKG